MCAFYFWTTKSGKYPGSHLDFLNVGLHNYIDNNPFYHMTYDT